MAYGCCDVKDCLNDTFMGWNKYQICEEHWEDHKDFLEEFDLHEVMGLHKTASSDEDRVDKKVCKECYECCKLYAGSCDGARKMCEGFVCLPVVDDGSREYYKTRIDEHKINLDF